jgi:hypothetical protein
MLGLFLSLALLDVSGQWRSVDVTSIESLPDYCMRVWVEERTWNLEEARWKRLKGKYRSVIRAVPVGATSLNPACKWPKPATKGDAAQIRDWSIRGRHADAGWNVSAEKGSTTGDLRRDQAFAFTTTLNRRGETLTSADVKEPRVFRRAAPPPPAATVALEKTIHHLHTGGCYEVITSIGFNAEEAQRSCALRKEIQERIGPYQSLTVTDVIEFDRIPTVFPASVLMKRQHGVLVSFDAKYEKQTVRGNAMLYDENGQWRVSLLWM